MTIIIYYPDRTEKIKDVDSAEFDDGLAQIQHGWPFEYRQVILSDTIKIEVYPND